MISNDVLVHLFRIMITLIKSESLAIELNFPILKLYSSQDAFMDDLIQSVLNTNSDAILYTLLLDNY